VILDNDQDRRVAAWLATVATDTQITAAVAALGPRAWPGKVAVRLGLEVPGAVLNPEAAAAATAAKARLAELRKEFASKAKS
jgi:hypothetical protein